MERKAEVTRKTKETDISVILNLDGCGKSNIKTGIGFFDHMLEGFAKHGFFDLSVTVDGDLQVDGHHSVEDAGIVLGTALKKALGDKSGIKRYGSCILPMDDALALCAWIYAADHILFLNAILLRKKWAAWIRSLYGNSFMPFHIVQK